MAATVTNDQIVSLNPVGATLRISHSLLVPDSSYATGGYAVTAAQLGLANVGFVLCNVIGGTTNNGAINATYNPATGKIQLWVTAGTSPVTMAEAAAAANLSGLTVEVIAFGF